eukprot:GHVS01007424.1.p1 GENE.GHVS01007424.1~~GHVS01007424.1.p1  ORF type:complete len:188 (-),score=6.94 GHVS01007424.1:106-669(-)
MDASQLCGKNRSISTWTRTPVVNCCREPLVTWRKYLCRSHMYLSTTSSSNRDVANPKVCSEHDNATVPKESANIGKRRDEGKSVSEQKKYKESEDMWDRWIPERKLSLSSPGFWLLFAMYICLVCYNRWNSNRESTVISEERKKEDELKEEVNRLRQRRVDMPDAESLGLPVPKDVDMKNETGNDTN